MFPRTQGGDRRGALLAVVVAVLLAVVGAGILGAGLRGSDGPPSAGAVGAAETSRTPDSPATRAPDEPAAPADRSTPGGTARDDAPDATVADLGPALPGSPPAAIDIPAIGVSSDDFVDLGLQADGSLEVPRDGARPGWFDLGPTPGQIGPAVIVGHVDSTQGPAVFYRLGELTPGERVEVTREDGSVATFLIDRVASYDKDEFPTREVYGTTDRAELRLITCSGEYDDEDGYLGNTVVFAHLVA